VRTLPGLPLMTRFITILLLIATIRPCTALSPLARNLARGALFRISADMTGGPDPLHFARCSYLLAPPMMHCSLTTR